MRYATARDVVARDAVSPDFLPEEQTGTDPAALLARRSLGVDVLTGAGPDANSAATDPGETIAFFGTATRNPLAARERAGVRHQVVLPIAGVHRVAGSAHHAGKREPERLVEAGPVPWTIVPATRFQDFAETVVGWTERDGVAALPPLPVRPVTPGGRHPDLAGPDRQDLVDMARRTLAARGREARLVPSWEGLSGPETARNVLLPGEGARTAPTSFEAWRAGQRACTGEPPSAVRRL